MVPEVASVPVKCNTNVEPWGPLASTAVPDVVSMRAKADTTVGSSSILCWNRVTVGPIRMHMSTHLVKVNTVVADTMCHGTSLQGTPRARPLGLTKVRSGVD